MTLNPITAVLCVRLIVGQAVYAQDDPRLLLERARELTVKNSENIPNYTCQQTVERQRYSQTGSSAVRRSCPEIVDQSAEAKWHLRLASTNRLHLDVAISEGREIFSWVGANKFDSDELGQIVGEGTVGTGDFGAFVISIFGSDSASFRFLGRQQIHDITLVEYSYRMPLEFSQYSMRVRSGLTPMAYEGKFQINASTGGLESLSIKVDEPPEGSGVCQVTTEIEYQQVRIGSGQFLLPRLSTLRMLELGGEVAVNRIQYRACREFSSESVLRLDSGIAPLANSIPAAAPIEVPRSLPVAIGLGSPIDMRTSAAGDPTRGVLRKSILDHSGAVLFQTGTPLRGRVMRMEERWRPSHYFILGLKFDEIETDGRWIPISLDWQPEKADADLNRPFPPRWADIGPFPIERRPGVGTFLFHDKRPIVVGSKFQSQWVTK